MSVEDRYGVRSDKAFQEGNKPRGGDLISSEQLRCHLKSYAEWRGGSVDPRTDDDVKKIIEALCETPILRVNDVRSELRWKGKSLCPALCAAATTFAQQVLAPRRSATDCGIYPAFIPLGSPEDKRIAMVWNPGNQQRAPQFRNLRPEVQAKLRVMSGNSAAMIKSASVIATDAQLQQSNFKGPLGAGETIRKLCEHLLYEVEGYEFSGDAICLVGADDEVFPPQCIKIVPDRVRYVLPEPFASAKPRLVSLLESRARLHGLPLFNGRCIRLVNYYATPIDPRDHTEQKHLELRLGRVDWYDYLIANKLFDDPEAIAILGAQQRVTNFIDFSGFLNDLKVTGSRLSNIVNLLVAATTTDGYLIYSKRGRVGLANRLLTSAVAENLHRRKDGVFTRRRDSSIFRGAARGIEEELSPGLKPANPTTEILLLGMAFNLMDLHPSLLFFVPLPYTRKQVETIRRKRRGKDYAEVTPMFVDLKNADELERALADDVPWDSDGKACSIRTLEYLTAIGKRTARSMAEVAAALPLRR